MDTYYCCMCLCVEVDLDLCLCVLWGRCDDTWSESKCAMLLVSKRADISLFPNLPNPNCMSQSTKNDHSIFIMGKGFSVSQRAFRCDDTRASLDELGFPSSFTFTPSCCTFFLSEWRGWFRHSSGSLLSSDRSLFPGFVSVICGHYINSHGWTEE